MGGGGGAEDNSAAIQQQQVMMMVQAVQAAQAEDARQKQQAENEARQADWMNFYNQQQGQWESQVRAQQSAMLQMQEDAARKAGEMRALMEEEAKRQAELEKHRIMAQEEADKLASMKTGMANAATAELDQQNVIRKRRNMLQPMKTLLTGGEGDTSTATVQGKTLLGQ